MQLDCGFGDTVSKRHGSESKQPDTEHRYLISRLRAVWLRASNLTACSSSYSYYFCRLLPGLIVQLRPSQGCASVRRVPMPRWFTPQRLTSTQLLRLERKSLSSLRMTTAATTLKARAQSIPLTH